MRIKETGKGTLYAKTGSGGDGKGNYNLGWFVGFVESNGKTLRIRLQCHRQRHDELQCPDHGLKQYCNRPVCSDFSRNLPKQKLLQ